MRVAGKYSARHVVRKAAPLPALARQYPREHSCQVVHAKGLPCTSCSSSGSASEMSSSSSLVEGSEMAAETKAPSAPPSVSTLR